MTRNSAEKAAQLEARVKLQDGVIAELKAKALEAETAEDAALARLDALEMEVADRAGRAGRGDFPSGAGECLGFDLRRPDEE